MIRSMNSSSLGLYRHISYCFKSDSRYQIRKYIRYYTTAGFAPKNSFFFSSTTASSDHPTTYAPPFNAPPFPPPPPLRPEDYGKPQRPKKKSTLKWQLLALLAGGAAYVYYATSTGGFPSDVKVLLRESNGLIEEAMNIDPLDPLSAQQRLHLLSQAEAKLKRALQSVGVPDPTSDKPTKGFFSTLFPRMIDPFLPPHILMKLGQVYVAQGPSRYKDAEKVYLAALQLFIEENKKFPPINTPTTSNSADVTNGGVTWESGLIDPKVLQCARQLAWVYLLEHNDVAAEAILFRCLQILQKLREQARIKKTNTSTPSTTAAPTLIDTSEPLLSTDNHDVLSLYDDDVAALICEDLSKIFRMRRDIVRAIEWSEAALTKINTQTKLLINNADKECCRDVRDSKTIDRLYQLVHILTALTADFYTMANDPPTPLPFPSAEPPPLVLARTYAEKAIKAVHCLIDAETSRAIDSNKNLKQSIESPNQLGSSHTPNSNYLFNEIFSLPNTALRSQLALELGGVYNNYARVLSAEGKKEEAVVFKNLAIKAVGLTNDESLISLIEEE